MSSGPCTSRAGTCRRVGVTRRPAIRSTCSRSALGGPHRERQERARHAPGGGERPHGGLPVQYRGVEDEPADPVAQRRSGRPRAGPWWRRWTSRAGRPAPRRTARRNGSPPRRRATRCRRGGARRRGAGRARVAAVGEAQHREGRLCRNEQEDQGCRRVAPSPCTVMTQVSRSPGTNQAGSGAEFAGHLDVGAVEAEGVAGAAGVHLRGQPHLVAGPRVPWTTRSRRRTTVSAGAAPRSITGPTTAWKPRR